MKRQLNKKERMLWGSIIFLFALAVLTFPFAFSPTWSLPRANTDRTLTYTTGKLTWDTDAEINDDGTIRLNIFENQFVNVMSADGSKIIAPGTNNSSGVRLLNTTGSDIDYLAVLYRMDNTGANITASVTGGSDTDEYVLPDGVSSNQVASAQTATLPANNATVIGVDWDWIYDYETKTDSMDTYVGNVSTDKIEYGLYVVVSEDSEAFEDGGASKSSLVLPSTGDNTAFQILLVTIVVLLCVLLLVAGGEKRREALGTRDDS